MQFYLLFIPVIPLFLYSTKSKQYSASWQPPNFPSGRAIIQCSKYLPLALQFPYFFNQFVRQNPQFSPSDPQFFSPNLQLTVIILEIFAPIPVLYFDKPLFLLLFLQFFYRVPQPLILFFQYFVPRQHSLQVIWKVIQSISLTKMYS